MATREKINRVRIENYRLSRIPISPSETIYQGDLICFNTATKLATKATSASGAQFIGMSETSNPIGTAGSPEFLSDTQNPRINVLVGLVDLIWGTNETVYPFDEVILDSSNDAQTARKGSSNPIGVVDPGYGAAGKAVTAGDLVRVWLQIRAAQFRTFGA